MTTKIETYGLDLIAQATNNVEAKLEAGVDEYDAYQEEVFTLIDVFNDESFLEWVLFTQELCDTYNVAGEYEAEQRQWAFKDTDDWRDGVQADFYHILLAAIENHIEDPIDVDIPEADPQDQADNKANGDVRNSFVLKKTVHREVEEIEEGDYEAYVDGIAARKHDFLQYAVLLNDITEEHDLQTWDGMTDTVVREKLMNGHFYWVIVQAILPELHTKITDDPRA